MTDPAYNKIAGQYRDFVRRNLVDETSVLTVATQALLQALGAYSDMDICDLACGEGHLSLALAEQAHSVVGIDLSSALVKLAQTMPSIQKVTFLVDDAQTLISQSDSCFDRVISNLALMDIPDLEATYQTVFRILRPSGRFIFSITHPCFQAPYASTEVDDTGRFSARRITTYASEGFWRSDHTSGIRGQVGAYHRTLSTYITHGVSTGFKVIELVEPTLPRKVYAMPSAIAQIEVPSVMVVVLEK